MSGVEWLEQVKRALHHIRGSDATEVEVSQPGLRLRVRRTLAVARAAEVDVGGAVAPSAGTTIVAPLTGIFYRASSPATQPHVVEGDPVQPDTVVGLIEAMKIFNEVLAERRGRVREILVQGGELVQAGDRLMLIDEAVEVNPGLGLR